LHDTQFADYHGMAGTSVRSNKRDRHGNLLTPLNRRHDDDAKKFSKAVHMASIHMEKGRQS